MRPFVGCVSDDPYLKHRQNDIKLIPEVVGILQPLSNIKFSSQGV